MLSTAALKDIAAGTSAGLVSVVVCHPLDTIRVRLQTAPAGRFTGVADVVRQTIKSEGPLAFYKGMAMPLMAQGAQKATMFFSFGYARRWILEANAAEGKPAGPLPIWQLALCGSFAGLCNTLVANPFELVRNRLQVQYHRDVSQAQYRGPLDAARQISAKAGVRALWLGVGPAMLRDAPGLGAWYGTFEGARRLLLPAGADPAKAPKSVTLAAGALAGVSYWCAAFMQDTIKNVIQTQGMNMKMGGGGAAVATGSGSGEHAVSRPINNGFWATGARLVREEGGWRRLWRGFPIAALRGIPGASSTFLTYQLVINYLNTH